MSTLYRYIDSEFGPTSAEQAHQALAEASATGWAYYVATGYQANAWTSEEVGFARAAGDILPVAVAPLSFTGSIQPPATFVGAALAQAARNLDSNYRRRLLCIDVEPGAFDSYPIVCASWIRECAGWVEKAGWGLVLYSVARCAARVLTLTVNPVPGYIWIADPSSTPDPATLAGVPEGAWDVGQRAQQFLYDHVYAGIKCDLSVAQYRWSYPEVSSLPPPAPSVDAEINALYWLAKGLVDGLGTTGTTPFYDSGKAIAALIAKEKTSNG